MTHSHRARQGDDRGARAILQRGAGRRPKATAQTADRDAAALSYLRRQAWRYPLGWIVGSLMSMWAAFWLITEHTKNSNPAVLTIELIGLMGGLPALIFGLGWFVRLVRRRRQVQLGHWVAYPARSTVMRQGPLRTTVVGLEITPTATLVLFPEHQFRSRIRRLVEREGQLLVLVSPHAKIAVGSLVLVESLADRFLFAGPSGQPVFAETGTHATAIQRQQTEQLGLAALARATGSAP